MQRKNYSVWVTIGLALCLQIPSGVEAQPLPIEAALDWKAVSGRRAQLSADGRMVVYRVASFKGGRLPRGESFDSTGVTGFQMNEIRVTDVRTGETRMIGVGEYPVWSPDGRHLAFFSNRDGRVRLWLWDRETGESRRVSDAIVRRYVSTRQLGAWMPIQWTPDGKHVLTSLLPEGMSLAEALAYIDSADETGEALAEGSTVTVYRPKPDQADRIEARNYRTKVYLCDVGLIDVDTGAVQRIARRVESHRYDLSPDGAYVAVADLIGSRVLVYSFASDQTQVIATKAGFTWFDPTLSWSPDSARLTYQRQGHWVVVSSADGTADLMVLPRRPLWDTVTGAMYIVNDGRLKLVPPDGSAARDVAGIAGQTVEQVVAPWQKFEWITSTNSGKTLYALTAGADAAQRTVYAIDVATGRKEVFSDALDAAGHTLARLQARIAQRPIVYLATGPTLPPDLWVVTPTRIKPRRLTTLNPVYERQLIGGSRLIEWTNDDGVTRRGAVLLPVGYVPGKRYPVVTWVYGSHLISKSIDSFGGDKRELLLLTTRGYVVFYPDSRVHPGTPMSDIARNVLPGINKLVELQIADPERLGVMGHSYGGYSTLALMVQTARFKAAVASAGGGYNMTSHYGGKMSANGTSEGVWWAEESGQGSMGGSPWEYREQYVENSPLFYLDRTTTPLLLLHGDRDPVPVSQSDEVYVAMRRLDKTVEYARYEGEGHSILYYPNMVDYWTRVVGWFDRYLKPQTEAALD